MERHQFEKRFTLALMFAVAVCAVAVMAPDSAFAIGVPSSGSFAYDIYNLAINQMLKGPIGFVAGVAAIVWGAVNTFTGKIMMAVPAILGGAALLKADSIVRTLGMTI